MSAYGDDMGLIIIYVFIDLNWWAMWSMLLLFIIVINIQRYILL